MNESLLQVKLENTEVGIETRTSFSQVNGRYKVESETGRHTFHKTPQLNLWSQKYIISY